MTAWEQPDRTDEAIEELISYLTASARIIRAELARVHTIETVLKIDLERATRGTDLAEFHLKAIEAELKLLRARHSKQLTVFFFTEGGKQQMNLLSNAIIALLLVLAESAKGNPIKLSAGPFTVATSDPNNTVTNTPGSADQTTPDSWLPNGTGNTGTVEVTVTDEGQTPPLVGVGSFNVVAPGGGGTGPVVPDTLTVTFAPATPAQAEAIAAKKKAV